eukprot:GHVS01053536.1.p1 GENE.GHVS01053536.1~~GHVS01053536.1.p1  ORF type:complete len:519 (+),score=77.71 GHVS01053536.1:142-1557(+)
MLAYLLYLLVEIQSATMSILQSSLTWTVLLCSLTFISSLHLCLHTPLLCHRHPQQQTASFAMRAAAARMSTTRSIAVVWALGRCGYAMAAVMHKMEQPHLSGRYIAVISVFVFTEILPLLLILDWDFIGMVVVVDDSANSGYTAPYVESLSFPLPPPPAADELSERSPVYPPEAFDVPQIAIDLAALPSPACVGTLHLGSIAPPLSFPSSTCFDHGRVVVDVISGRKFSRFLIEDILADVDRLIALRADAPILPIIGAAVVTQPVHSLWLVYACCPHAISLHDLLHRPEELATDTYPQMATTLREKLVLIRAVASCLARVHSRELTHGSLTSHSVLVVGPAEVMLADLRFHALKRFLSVVDNYEMRSAWSAPDILSGASRVFDTSHDIYSLGMILWEAVTTFVPFKNCSLANLIKIVVTNRQRPLIAAYSGAPADVAVLIRSCWAETAAERPSAEVVVRMLDHIIDEQLST